jgi:hypothetical protein
VCNLFDEEDWGGCAITFSCRYADGRSQPHMVLAVGPNLNWEFFGIAARSMATAVAGLEVLVVSGTMALTIGLVVAVKRRSSRMAGLGVECWRGAPLWALRCYRWHSHVDSQGGLGHAESRREDRSRL